MGWMEEYDAAVTASRTEFSPQPRMQDLIRFETLAPNGHNTQPWKFRIGSDHWPIFPDFSRQTPVVDPVDHHLFVSLGTAAKTLATEAASRSQPGDVRFDSAGSGAAAVVFSGSRTAEAAL
jgi:hypothetical protein